MTQLFSQSTGKSYPFWVVCCGMLRSASTLQYQLTITLLTKLGLGRGLGIQSAASFPQLFRDHIQERAILVIKMHEYSDDVEALVVSGNAKLIYSYRDIRDVIISWMRMQGWSFEQILERRFIEDSCLYPYEKWTSLSDVLITRYENLVNSQLTGEVRRIAAHLGLDVAENLVQWTANNHTIENQKAQIARFDYVQKGVQSGATSYNPDTLLHNNHIWSGAVDQWREILSAEEINKVENIAGNWLDVVGYSRFTFHGDANPTLEAIRAETEVSLISRSTSALIAPQESGFPLTTGLVCVMPNERVVEIPWALMQLPHNGTILDIGSCEATYLSTIVNPGRILHCLDVRDCQADLPENVYFHHQSLIGNDLPASYFDAILVLSTLEHIGLPHYDQQGLENSDVLALSEIRRLLKPSGSTIITLPAGRSKLTLWYRQYSPEDIKQLFAQWQYTVDYWGFRGGAYQKIDESEVTSFDYDYAHGSGAVACIVARILA